MPTASSPSAITMPSGGRVGDSGASSDVDRRRRDVRRSSGWCSEYGDDELKNAGFASFWSPAKRNVNARNARSGEQRPPGEQPARAVASRAGARGAAAPLRSSRHGLHDATATRRATRPFSRVVAKSSVKIACGVVPRRRSSAPLARRSSTSRSSAARVRRGGAVRRLRAPRRDRRHRGRLHREPGAGSTSSLLCVRRRRRGDRRRLGRLPDRHARYGTRLLGLAHPAASPRGHRAGARRASSDAARPTSSSGRFTAFFRAVVPGLAGHVGRCATGASSSPTRPARCAGACGYALLGYFAGNAYTRVEHYSTYAAIGVAALVVALAVAFSIRGRAPERARRRRRVDADGATGPAERRPP